MRRIRRQIKDIKPSVLPNLEKLFDFVGSMHLSITQDHHRGFGQRQGKGIQSLNNEIGIDVFFLGFVNKIIGTRQQTKAIDGTSFGHFNGDEFVLKLPAVRHVTFLGHFGCIPVVQVNVASSALCFQQTRGFPSYFIQLGIRFAFDLQTDSLLSALKFFKKRFSVRTLNFLLRVASNAAFASWRRWRSFWTAALTSVPSAT